MRLSVGAGSGIKIFAAIAGVIVLGGAGLFFVITVFVGAFFDLVGAFDPTDVVPSGAPGLDPSPDPSLGPEFQPPDILSGPAGAAARIIRMSALCAVPVVAIIGYVILRILRYAIWLEGTTAVARGAILTRQVDLATADVRGDAVTQTQTHGSYRSVFLLPAVSAQDPRTGRSVKIPLRGQGLKRLPPAQLEALADAIMTRRQPTDPGYPAAAAVSECMRQMAADPFPT